MTDSLRNTYYEHGTSFYIFYMISLYIEII